MKIMSRFLVVAVLLICFGFPMSNAFAIGQWRKGTVTQRPWTGKYMFVKINNVKYTIMENVKMSFVYEENGARYKDTMNISSIHTGDIVVVKVEGNRIYQVEKIR